MSTIQILTPTEIRNYELPPRFDSFNRKKFFALPIDLMKEAEELEAFRAKLRLFCNAVISALQTAFSEAGFTKRILLLLMVVYLCRILFL